MTIAPGDRLGPYEIVGPLGAGGMGEVYRARDTRLEREVALKVLRADHPVTEDARRRFEREARAISSLSHPNICTLYDVGTEGGMDFLVMEMLEGETLASRLERGPLSVEEVLRLGIQATDALTVAHAAGIVHRDIKPGNIFLTKHGAKLLDFGLARLHATQTPQSPGAVSQEEIETLSRRLTGTGTILGTVPYMAPEQLEGRDADPRTDLFALGAVLYEAATGQPAFSGESRASLIGAVMNTMPPEISSLAPLAPPALGRVVATCMAKEPRDRWQSAHDVGLDLAWILEGGSLAGSTAPVARRRRHRERWAWGAAAAATLAAVLFAYGYLRRAPVPPRVLRFEIAMPPNLPIVGSPEISPDGRHLAFGATDDQGKHRIWLRNLDELEAHPLAGTEGAGQPFWSPDSRSIAFVAGNKLERVDISGGALRTICDAPGGESGSWGDGETILFDGSPDPAHPIQRVAAAGGLAAPAVTSRSDFWAGWPQFLPGGKKFLYLTGKYPEQPTIAISSLSDGAGREVGKSWSRVEYAPPGYLVFVRNTTLVAQHFDVDSGTLSGDPVPLAEGLGTAVFGGAEFSVSRGGVLAYRRGLAADRQFVWLDQRGRRLGAASDVGPFSSFSLSPDGRYLAHETGNEESFDIWIRDLKRGVESRFTFGPDNELPLFSPDGHSLVYLHREEAGHWQILERSVDRPSEQKVLFESDDFKMKPLAVTPDGEQLIFSRYKTSAPTAIWIVPIGHPERARPLTVSRFSDQRGALSPDGRWVAFQSNESGSWEIYVTPLNGHGGRRQVSTHGGEEPRWGREGKALYYVSPGHKMMRAEVRPGIAFDMGRPQELFSFFPNPGGDRTRYLVAPDGRFLVLSARTEQGVPPTTIVVNWQASLAAKGTVASP